MLEVTEIVDKFVIALCYGMIALGVMTSNWYLPLYISLAATVIIQLPYVVVYFLEIRKRSKQPSLKGYIDESRGDVIGWLYYVPLSCFIWYSVGTAGNMIWVAYS